MITQLFQSAVEVVIEIGPVRRSSASSRLAKRVPTATDTDLEAAISRAREAVHIACMVAGDIHARKISDAEGLSILSGKMSDLDAGAVSRLLAYAHMVMK
jgi:hypothetical protein